MTYAWTQHGSRAHILRDGATRSGSMEALCGVEAHHPTSASEEDIREAERNLCRTCKDIRG